MRTVVFGAAGCLAGALVALVVATLVNANCDSLLEAAEGCGRLDVGGTAYFGATIGAVAGAVAGAVWRP